MVNGQAEHSQITVHDKLKDRLDSFRFGRFVFLRAPWVPIWNEASDGFYDTNESCRGFSVCVLTVVGYSEIKIASGQVIRLKGARRTKAVVPINFTTSCAKSLCCLVNILWTQHSSVWDFPSYSRTYSIIGITVESTAYPVHNGQWRTIVDQPLHKNCT